MKGKQSVNWSEETAPVFNLKVVAQKTGVSAQTLRAWERRYGLPRPHRSPSGRRLYSLRDIQTVKWLAQRVAEGMTIGQAVALWRELEAAGQDPLQAPSPFQTQTYPMDVYLDKLRQTWVAAILNFDEKAADSVLTQAFALYPPETVCFEILLEGLREIGDLWYSGEATVAQEHFASSLAVRRIESLIQTAPPPSWPGRFLVIAPPLEFHSFNLRLLTYLLRQRGWDVVYLGANVPLDRLKNTLQAVKPLWVITAAQYTAIVAEVVRLAHVLRAEGIPLGYGGGAFNQLPTLRRRIPGYFLGERLEEAPQRLEQWVVRGPPAMQVEPIPESYQKALELFRSLEMDIWGTVLMKLTKQGIAHDWLAEFGDEFNLHLKSALATGEMALMDVYFSWLRGLRGGYTLPRGWLTRYLLAYAEALEQCMGPDADFIADYLKVRAREALGG